MTPLEEEDLKRPDRVPDRVPKVGDLVKIKSRAWFDKWVGPKIREVSGIVPPMAEFCGRIMPVTSVRKNYYLGKFDTFQLDGDNGVWTWCITDFEDVYPADSVMAVIESNLYGDRSLVKKAVENCRSVSVSTGESPSDGIVVTRKENVFDRFWREIESKTNIITKKRVPIFVGDSISDIAAREIECNKLCDERLNSDHPKYTPLKLVDINPIKLKKV